MLDYEKINENMGKREALNEARTIVSDLNNDVFEAIMALDVEDPEFNEKHARLNGQYDLMSELYCTYTAKITALTLESVELWKEVLD